MTDFPHTIHTIIINLPKDIERRAFMEMQLDRLSIPFTILSATDGRTHDFAGIYDEERAIRCHGAPLTAPEKGCALSHKRALESFLASGEKYGLIMEDDVVLGDEFMEAVGYALSRSDWTYIQFNYGPVGIAGIKLWWFLLSNRKKSAAEFPLLFFKGLAVGTLNILWGIRDTLYRVTGKGKLARLVRDQYLAGCYLVTRDAAGALVALNTPLTYTADRIQNIARNEGLIHERIYVPRIVRQKRESFASSINNDHYGKKIISA
jgi:hypothetical protein